MNTTDSSQEYESDFESVCGIAQLTRPYLHVKNCDMKLKQKSVARIWQASFYGSEIIRFAAFVLNNHNFFANDPELQASPSYTWTTRNMVRSRETSVDNTRRSAKKMVPS